MSALLDAAMFGWWFAVIFAPHKRTKASKFKLVRIAGLIICLMWFALLLPVTFVIFIALGAVDGWKNV
jgi:hypothetical protein